MLLNSTIEAVGNAYHVQVGLSSADGALDANELKALREFGEPVIECGGTLSSGNTAMVLAANQLRFPSQFPVKHVFPRAGDAYANAKAVVWRDFIKAAILAGLQAKRALVEGTIGRWDETISTAP